MVCIFGFSFNHWGWWYCINPYGYITCANTHIFWLVNVFVYYHSYCGIILGITAFNDLPREDFSQIFVLSLAFVLLLGLLSVGIWATIISMSIPVLMLYTVGLAVLAELMKLCYDGIMAIRASLRRSAYEQSPYWNLESDKGALLCDSNIGANISQDKIEQLRHSGYFKKGQNALSFMLKEQNNKLFTNLVSQKNVTVDDIEKAKIQYNDSMKV